MTSLPSTLTANKSMKIKFSTDKIYYNFPQKYPKIANIYIYRERVHWTHASHEHMHSSFYFKLWHATKTDINYGLIMVLRHPAWGMT